MIQRFNIFGETLNPFGTLDESTDFLRQARDRYDVLNLSYWFLGSSADVPDQMTWLSTYDAEYMAHYMREYTPVRDNAFNIGFRRLLPLDWAEVRDNDETVQTIHEVAERYGIGRHGISFPIRDTSFGDAMFSVNFECEDRHWQEVRNQIVSGFHLFAHYYHLRMKDIVAGRSVSSEFDLAPREREVLQWAAEGKTAWETAQLLGVSERAVQLYTANAMQKLRAKTKTQAVAIAYKNAMLH